MRRLQIELPPGRGELGEGFSEQTASDHVVRHLLTCFFAANGAAIRRLQSNQFHLLCPLFVVIPA
jgi:hypothetical protein